jgi:hypothetical protein
LIDSRARIALKSNAESRNERAANRVFRTRDRRHFRRQRQIVRLMLEQRIRHHFDFVKLNFIAQFDKTRRQTRRNKMHRVTAQPRSSRPNSEPTMPLPP